MSEDSAAHARAAVDAVYQSESRRVMATLIGLLGDFDLAEEALHTAITAALESWPRDGVPANPRSWLISTGRFKAIDAMRRRARFDASLAELADRLETTTPHPAACADEDGVDDDRLNSLAHSARADLLRRLGRTADAAAAYRTALELTRQGPERRFIERRLRELGATGSVIR